MVRFGRHRAFLREAEWRCADPAFEQSLNDEMDAWMKANGDEGLATENARRPKPKPAKKGKSVR